MTAIDACECGHSIDRHGWMGCFQRVNGGHWTAEVCDCHRPPSSIRAARVAAAERGEFVRLETAEKYRARAEAAEQARAEVEAKVRALADKWEAWAAPKVLDLNAERRSVAKMTVRYVADLRAALSDAAAPEAEDRDDWPCDNYTEPHTCLSVGASRTACCRVCKIRAADRIIGALKGDAEADSRARADEQAIRERIAQDIETEAWERWSDESPGTADPGEQALWLHGVGCGVRFAARIARGGDDDE